jgi:hypothetical protein
LLGRFDLQRSGQAIEELEKLNQGYGKTNLRDAVFSLLELYYVNGLPQMIDADTFTN